MGIFINGVKLGNGKSKNVIIVNGHIVSDKKASKQSQKFDEKKNIRADGVNRINVKCDSVNVVVTASNTDVIDAHFYGEAIVDDKPMFNLVKNKCEVSVALNINGSVCGNLTLEIGIPMRMFEMLNITSYNGNVSVKSDVSAKRMRLDTHNGDVESNGSFSKISATTHNGNVDVYVDAKNNVEIEASSHNGNVAVELQNITVNNISISTCNGNEKNHFRGKNGGYTAYGWATSHNGNVSVK